MRIYFGYTVVGDRSTLEIARSIVQKIEDLGHEVLTRHLVSDGGRTADLALGAQAVYQRDMAWLGQCDIFIAEVSGSSFGVGFESGYLLGATDKRVILLYEASRENKLSLLILGNTHPNCTLVPYSTVADVTGLIEKHVGRAVTLPGV
jgi:2'-deoxynucleoside 5'-phosphate N-hydrolase